MINSKNNNLIEKRYELFANWLYNLKQNKINHHLLIICSRKRYITNDIKHLISRVCAIHDNKCIIETLDKIDNINIVDYNTIFIANRGISLKWLHLRNREFIFICEEIVDFINHIENDIDNYSATPIVDKSMEHLFFIKRRDPIEIVYKDIQFIKELLYSMYNSMGFDEYGKIDNILSKRFSFNLVNDLNFLERENKLTSRLAHHIYRVATLDALVNSTNSGTFYAKEFSSKSKPLNSRYFNISNVRGYIVPRYESYEEKIRKEIAKSLEQHTNLDMDTICKVTKISTKEITNKKQHISSSSLMG
jgi:hypothetical protein